jgi:hypothetical protein
MQDPVNSNAETDSDCSIRITELGRSVLTPAEVLQTFEDESGAFNIKLAGSGDCRAVVLKKQKVEIDGQHKLIVMIRDITNKVRLEEERAKKEKQKAKVFPLQQALNNQFAIHCEKGD